MMLPSGAGYCAWRHVPPPPPPPPSPSPVAPSRVSAPTSGGSLRCQPFSREGAALAGVGSAGAAGNGVSTCGGANGSFSRGTLDRRERSARTTPPRISTAPIRIAPARIKNCVASIDSTFESLAVRAEVRATLPHGDFVNGPLAATTRLTRAPVDSKLVFAGSIHPIECCAVVPDAVVQCGADAAIQRADFGIAQRVGAA